MTSNRSVERLDIRAAIFATHPLEGREIGVVWHSVSGITSFQRVLGRMIGRSVGFGGSRFPRLGENHILSEASPFTRVATRP